MPDRQIFKVLTPLGNWVVLSRNRWRQIARYKHRAIEGRVAAVRACLKSPIMIRESAKNPAVHLYYGLVNRGYLCVVTAPSDRTEYFVVTAYFTKNIKPGNELWKK